MMRYRDMKLTILFSSQPDMTSRLFMQLLLLHEQCAGELSFF